MVHLNSGHTGRRILPTELSFVVVHVIFANIIMNENRIILTQIVSDELAVSKPSGGNVVRKILAIGWEVAPTNSGNIVVVARISCRVTEDKKCRD